MRALKKISPYLTQYTKINSKWIKSGFTSELVSESHSAVPNSLQPHGLYSPWDSQGQNTGVGSLSLLQGIFPTQGSNPGHKFVYLTKKEYTEIPALLKLTF